jgi:hypothetical protein
VMLSTETVRLRRIHLEIPIPLTDRISSHNLDTSEHIINHLHTLDAFKA